MISITSRDCAHFANRMNAELDALMISNQQDVRIAVAALRALLVQDQMREELPLELQERISRVRSLMDDPLSINDLSLYPLGHLQQYQRIAQERIQSKVSELLCSTPHDLERETHRLCEQQALAARNQAYLSTCRPPIGVASTLSERDWLVTEQENFIRERQGFVRSFGESNSVARALRNAREDRTENNNVPESVEESPQGSRGMMQVRRNFFDIGTLRAMNPGFVIDRAFALDMVRNNAGVFRLLHISLQQDRSFMVAALQANREVYHFFAPEWRQDPEIFAAR